MYSYGYSYGYGLVGGNTYNPLINYDWSTTTAKEYKTDGVELVVNGGFDTDLSGWINTNSYWQWNNGMAYHPDGTVNNGLSQGYKAGLLTFDTEVISGALAVEFNGVTTYYTESGTYSIYSEAETFLKFKRNVSFHGYLDNISVQKVIQEPNKRYLKDVGSTPTYNASMYFGRGAYLNGVDQYITKDIVITEGSTLLLTVNFNTLTSRSDTFLGAVGNIRIGCNDSTTPMFIDTRGIGGSIAFLAGTQLKDETLTHQLALTFSRGKVSSYIDGVYKGIYIVNYTGLTFTTIGANAGRGEYFKGIIKDVFLFNRVLTQSEITQSYEQPEAFYAMAQADSTCVLNMPMCETSSTARNYKTGIDYPITNYTTSVRDNAKNLRYGLQTCKFVRDSLGVIQSTSNYLECDGTGYATIPNHIDKVNIKMTVNPTSLSGNLLSGGVTKTLTGLTLNVDNDVVVSNVTPTGTIDLASGFSGTIKTYKEELV